MVTYRLHSGLFDIQTLYIIYLWRGKHDMYYIYIYVYVYVCIHLKTKNYGNDKMIMIIDVFLNNEPQFITYGAYIYIYNDNEWL